MQYFTRYRFVQGLSKYNEDDTAFEREEMHKVMEKEYHRQIREIEVKRAEGDDDLVDDLYHSLGRMAKYMGENDRWDKVVVEFLLNTYDNIDEQEFEVCKEIIWTIWDIREPMYAEVVARILISSHEKRNEIFSNIKEVEDTIQRLVRKGILSQYIYYTCNHYKNGNLRKIYDEPHIIIPFTNDPDEALNAISENFGRIFKSFFVPLRANSTNDDSEKLIHALLNYSDNTEGEEDENIS